MTTPTGGQESEKVQVEQMTAAWNESVSAAATEVQRYCDDQNGIVCEDKSELDNFRAGIAEIIQRHLVGPHYRSHPAPPASAP